LIRLLNQEEKYLRLADSHTQKMKGDQNKMGKIIGGLFVSNSSVASASDLKGQTSNGRSRGIANDSGTER